MLRLGHRGACGHAPENTLLSIQKALDFGVDGFEFDIQLSKDGQPMVIHDDTLERTTNGTGKVADYTLAQLQQFDAGQGQIIPSLQDVITFVNRRCRLFIELKAEHSEIPVIEHINQAIQDDWSYDQFYLCSFDHPQLFAARKLNPSINTCALFAGIPVQLAQLALDAGTCSINPCIHHISQALVDDAHRKNLKVFSWTVNLPAHIEKAKQMGIDGIFSDYPDRL